jgi:hypothetical protein
MLVYVLNKQTERDRKRQYMKDKFKREHGIANKVLDMITKNGIIYKWIKAQKGPISTTFKELFSDIAQTLFDEWKKNRVKKTNSHFILVINLRKIELAFVLSLEMSYTKRNDDDEETSCLGRNLVKLIVTVCLIIVALACSITLAMVLIKQGQRERVLLTKKSTWSARLEKCAPVLKIAGPIVRIIIKVAFSVLLI